MKQTQTIPETFLGVGYTRDRAGLPLEAVRVPVPRPAADQVLIRVAASSLNPLEYKLADLNNCRRTACRRSCEIGSLLSLLPQNTSACVVTSISIGRWLASAWRSAAVKGSPEVACTASMP